MKARRREERTTRSRYFDWVEDVTGEYWYGLRNTKVFFMIEKIYNDDGEPRYFLGSALRINMPGRREYLRVEAAKKAADTSLEDWTHSWGLMIGPEWWKEDRDG